MTSIRLDIQLADEDAKALGVKSRTEPGHIALREIVALSGANYGERLSIRGGV